MRKFFYTLLALAMVYIAVQYLLPMAERQAMISFFQNNPDAATVLADGSEAVDPIDRHSEIAQIYESYYGVNPYGTKSTYNNDFYPQPIDSLKEAAPLITSLIRKRKSHLIDSLNVDPYKFRDRGQYDVLEVRNKSPFSDDVRVLTIYVIGEYVGGVKVDWKYDNGMDARSDYAINVTRIQGAVGEAFFEENEGIPARGGFDKAAKVVWATQEGDILMMNRSGNTFRTVLMSSPMIKEFGLDKFGM